MISKCEKRGPEIPLGSWQYPKGTHVRAIPVCEDRFVVIGAVDEDYGPDNSASNVISIHKVQDNQGVMHGPNLMRSAEATFVDRFDGRLLPDVGGGKRDAFVLTYHVDTTSGIYVKEFRTVVYKVNQAGELERMKFTPRNVHCMYELSPEMSDLTLVEGDCSGDGITQRAVRSQPSPLPR